ncbi:DUF2271 domain-containing protein [candidate division KSB1 bacterium]|nr:DUF2271 domain-containing protein [candidate division KSB1 bacterium]
MTRFNIRNGIIILLLSVMVVSCNKKKIIESETKGYLTINYQISDYDLLTVIWLEDLQNNYVKTLLVSEWLSYDGHRYPDICPDWSSVADWENVSKTVFDEVTTATPQIDTHKIVVDCEQINLPDGEYHYLVETHIENEFNILYSGQIEIGDKPDSDTAEVTYIPGAHQDSTKLNLLSDVSAEYKLRNR